MEQGIVELYDTFSRGDMNRRTFFDRLTQITGSTGAAVALMTVLEKDDAVAQTIAEDDNRLATTRVQYDAAGTKIAGYLARPTATGKHPAVIVIHANQGLHPHYEDVARRLAVEGFVALAPDLLSPLGGTPGDAEQAIKMIGTLKADETVARLAGAVPFLTRHPQSTGKVGVVGFCWGGGMVNRLAAAGTSLAAAIAYYGMQIPAAEVPKISAPLLLHYAELDPRIDAGIADYEAALKANNKPYEKYLYEGANHGFNNDANAAAYNQAAATLAWSRTVAFLRKYLAA